jgi:hypothetical protein
MRISSLTGTIERKPQADLAGGIAFSAAGILTAGVGDLARQD